MLILMLMSTMNNTEHRKQHLAIKYCTGNRIKQFSCDMFDRRFSFGSVLVCFVDLNA